MKQFTLRRITFLTALLSILGVSNVWAQLTELQKGKVYHFTNVGYTDKAMAATSPGNVGGVAKDQSNKMQLWYVAEKNSSGYYALLNLGYGTYLQGNSQSSKWTLANTTASNNTWMQLSSVNGNNVFKGYTYGNYGYAHIDGSSNIVGWETDSNPTQWNISEITITPDIQASIDIFTSSDAAATHLANLFEDQACTTLKTAYASAASLQNSADYQALPATLKAMALKIANNSWAEANYNTSKEGWDNTRAKRYRVQLYEPYNDIDLASTALSLNTHTNMNNPTGIFANNGDVLYVMVQGEIKDHATLYLSSHTGHGRLGGAKDGYELKSGLNVVPVYNDESNFYVNYVVETFDTSNGKRGNQAKARKLSDFPNLTIHIEGGHINGYYNKVGDTLYGEGDKNADWEYLEARATQRDLTILGQYMTLQFPLNDADTEGNKGLGYYLNDKVNIEDVINAWDNVMLWERLLLGVLGESATGTATKQSPYSKTSSKNVIEYTGNDTDGFQTGYGEYYNIHGLAQGVGGDTYMYGVGDHSGYHYSTMESIIQNIPTNVGSHWGPAHEIGHQHQNLINMRGEMEVSNNLFSNVVLWMFGETTSRVNGSEGSLENVLNNFNNESGHYLTNSIWGMTQMYYKLFLYYHVLGHNPKFYPRLFEMLRQDPQRDNRAGTVDGANAQLHLYKKVCAAAGEDLTEFFRAHGFFKPLNGWSIEDYGWSTYNMTQEQINAAIAEVKAQAKSKGWTENTAIIFINDATGEAIRSHRNDVEYLAHYDVNESGQKIISSELGCYTTFIENVVAPNYTYSISGTTVTMEGEGGVGFAILNEKGELIGFSDKKTFEISAEVKDAIINKNATFVVLNGNNTTTTTTAAQSSESVNHSILGELIEKVHLELGAEDNTGNKIGYYKPSALTKLSETARIAQDIYDKKEYNSYVAIYNALKNEYDALKANPYVKNLMLEGTFIVRNYGYENYHLTVTGDPQTKFDAKNVAEAQVTEAEKWVFEAATDGNYYLRNLATQKYVDELKNNIQGSVTGETGTVAYKVISLSIPGVFAIECQTGDRKSLNYNSNKGTLGWSYENDPNSWWYITAVDVDMTLKARTKLEELVGKTEALVNEIATYSTEGTKLTLQTTNTNAANYLSTNACHNTLNNASDGQGLAGLLDESTDTYFHSDYKEKVSDTHYLQVDLGANHTVEQFKFNYATRDNGNNCPTAILVEGSADGSTFNQLATYTAANDELPNGNALSWESPTIKNNSKYRYLRFSVTATGNSQVYFVMSTFGVTDMTPVVNEIKDGYTVTLATIKSALYELAEAQLLIDGAKAEKSVYETQFEALDSYYQTLLTAANDKVNAALEAKKAELQILINNTDALIDECVSVEYTEETTPQLNVTATPYKLSDNNGASEGSLDKLYDGKQGKDYSYTSNWSNNPTEAPYLQVDLGTGNELEELIFTFTNRNEGNAPTPTEIVVSASTDGNVFTEFATFTSAEHNLPPAANGSNITATKWTSPVIQATSACRYWRFTVTKSQRNSGGETNSNGIYHFGISEFGIVIPASYNVTVKPGMGEVTKTLILDTYQEVAEAQSSLNYATTEAQLDKAIAQLQAQYNALLEAKNNQYVQVLRDKISKTEELIAECGRIENGEVVEVFETAGDVTKQQLLETYNQVATAQALIDAGGATQREYEDATNALETKRTALATAKAGTKKSTLRTLTEQMSALITLCGTTPGDATEAMISEMTEANDVAIALLATDDLEAIVATTGTLQTQYNTLSAAQQSTVKADLRALIAQMDELIAVCGEVSAEEVRKETPYTLQVGNSSKGFYLSSNADQNVVGNNDDGKGIAALIDGTVDTYMHTQWNGTNVNEIHHVQVSNIEDLQDFTFTYATRKGQNANNTSPAPTIIEVYGSTDGSDFSSLIARVTSTDGTNALPSYTKLGEYWTSADLNGSGYTALRFKVLQSDGPGKEKHGEYYFFAMSEFGLTGIKYEKEVTLSENAGAVSEALLIAAIEANSAAAEFANNSADQAALNAKKNELQALYDAMLADSKEMNPALAEAVESAKNLLVTTPLSVGYPTQAQRATFQEVIDAHESVEAINNAKAAFIETTNIIMPENGKAYRIKAWWRNAQWPLTFISADNTTTNNNLYTPAYVPVEGAEGDVFVCRLIDETQGTYAFISENGYYLGWQAQDKANNTSKEFNVNNVTNTWMLKKAVTNNNGTRLTTEEIFGTVNMYGQHSNENTWYDYMYDRDVTYFRDAGSGTGSGTKYYSDNAHTVYYTFEEVSNYSLNKVNLTGTKEDRDLLLQNIEYGKTISTFSAPYATVIPNRVTAYYATQANEGGMIYLKAIDKGLALPANEGVILVGESSVEASDFVPATSEEVANLKDENGISINKFANSASSSVVMQNNDYILANGEKGIGIYKAKASTTLKQGKAFLRFGTNTSLPSLVMKFGGNTTGVEGIPTEEANAQQAVYDIYGRRVNEVTKGGIYIVNGKKVFIK